MLGFRMGLKEFTNTWYNIKKPVLSDYFVLKVFKSMILDLESKSTLLSQEGQTGQKGIKSGTLLSNPSLNTQFFISK